MRGTLAVVAARWDAAGLARARAAAAAWNGPVAFVVLGAGTSGEDVAQVSDLLVVAAGGDVAAALRPGQDPALTQAAAAAVFEATAAHAPLAAVLCLADADLLPLVPALGAASFPAPFQLEFSPGTPLPDATWLWQHADAVLLRDAGLLYGAAAGQPALPVRLLGPDGDDEADLPLFGGPPRVSVIVPVRGQAELVLRMADSVLARTPGLLELILVDDASPDRTLPRLERLAAQDARVRLFANDGQRGFAATCNRGLAAARGELVIALNADTVVTPGWAARLDWHLRNQPKAGIVGPLSNRVSGLQHVAPVDYDERSLAGLLPWSDRLARDAARRARGVVRLTGLCVAFSRTALRRVGGFDPRFFPGNYEDDDYCLRLLAGGLVPYCADDTFIHHEGSKSFALEPVAYRQLLAQNWDRFKDKWRLPADRPVERHYSPEELALRPYVRERHFIAPWSDPVPATR